MTDSTADVFPSNEEWSRLRKVFGWSEREAEVVGLTLTGARRREIAARLGISIHTVHTNLRRASAKAPCGDLMALTWLIVDQRDAMRGYRAPRLDVPARLPA
jgi:DNA-binding NarL/FixJ family response regulator